MSLNKMIKDLEESIYDVKMRLKCDLTNPEEKLRNARDSFDEARARDAETYIRLCMEREELEGQLTKPIEEYRRVCLGSQRHFKSVYQHPAARRIEEINAALKPEYFMRSFTYQEMIRRKDILDNFSGLRTAAENELDVLEGELKALREVAAKRDAKKKPPKARPVHTISIKGPYAHTREYEINHDDLMGVIKNGARGLSVSSEKGAVSIPKNVLRDIYNGARFDAAIGEDGVIFRAPGAYLKFIWRPVSDGMNRFCKPVTEYPEAHINVSL